MEAKGRIIKAGPVEYRQRKDGTGTYAYFPIEVQVGVYKTWRIDRVTGQTAQTEKIESLRYVYTGERANTASMMFQVGAVVNVVYHPHVKENGFNDLEIADIKPLQEMAVPTPNGQMQNVVSGAAPMSPEANAAAGYTYINQVAQQNGARFAPHTFNNDQPQF